MAPATSHAHTIRQFDKRRLPTTPYSSGPAHFFKQGRRCVKRGRRRLHVYLVGGARPAAMLAPHTF
jgi:hypothetical protein